MKQNTKPRLSRLRRTLLDLREMPGRLFPVFLDKHPLVKGTVYSLRRRCGKPGCRCAKKGERHESLVWTASVRGRTRLKSLAADQVTRVRELTQRYQRVRAARAEFVRLYGRMVHIIDELERLRRVDIP